MSTPVSNLYPRFIVDKPEGADQFEGQSQSRIVENIMQFLTENNDISRKVIGIEGEWGSGKSNVIEILKKKLKDKYYFFVFDAWGHQEDLTRRSILEELLAKLIKDNALKGKKEDWDGKLKQLLSKKIETEHKSIPRLSWAVILTVLGIVFLPITKNIGEIYLKAYTIAASPTSPVSNPNLGHYLVAALIFILSFLPLAVWIIFSICKAKKGEKNKVFEEIFYIYKGQEILNRSEETISENEPTVQQFTKFLSDIESGTDLKLVIVFDNMDRLPASKVKEVWSSIHTFFASDDNDLKTWAIVPFDNAHICNIFTEDDKSDDKYRADSYIHKTFSIVFHISPPILSDWKSFFGSKFKSAFGSLPPTDQQLETIFDYQHLSSPKIKPRDIIYFINDLVALRKIWNESIPFKYLALFSLKRDAIMQNPFDQIVSRKYLDSLTILFEFDEQLETYISALAFNVPIEKADEVLLKRPIENALRGEGDLLKLSTHSSFFVVFESVFYNSSPDVDHTIISLNSLPKEIQDNFEMMKYWEKLASRILKISNFQPKDVYSIITIIRRLKNATITEQLLKFLFIRANSTFNPENQAVYYGSKYYNLISEIQTLLQEVWPEKSVEDLLPKRGIGPEEFFDFVKVCPHDYQKYKVNCDAKRINEFLSGKFDGNEITPFVDAIKSIKSIIDLSEFRDGVATTIPLTTINSPSYQTLLTNVIDVGKALNIDGRSPFTIDEAAAIQVLSVAPPHNRSFDLFLYVIKSNVLAPKPEHLTNAEYIRITADLNQKVAFVENYSYYLSYEDLIRYQLQFPTILIKGVIIDLTLSDDILKGDIKYLLTNYDQIKSKIFDDKLELCNSFIRKVNELYVGEDISFLAGTPSGYITSIINDNPIECKLITDIVIQANKFICEFEKDQWVTLLSHSQTDEDFQLVKTLLELNKFGKDQLPQHIFTGYAEIIRKISKKEIAIPTDVSIWNKIEDLFNFNNTTIYKDVRDELLNYNHQAVTMDELLFFEKGLFKYGKVSEAEKVADDMLRRILTPLANGDEEYTDVLKRNSKNIKKIIEKANDSIIEFKQALDSKCPHIYADVEFSQILIEKNDFLSNQSSSQYENGDGEG